MQAQTPDRDRGHGFDARHGAVLLVVLATSGFTVGGCGERKTPPSPAPSEPAVEASVPENTGGRRGYEIPIPQLEFWEGSDRVPKYTYEMRFDAPGANGRRGLHRNGWARAYYSSGGLEREGAYQWIPDRGRSERVGRWTYYDTDGNVDRVEDRGGDPIWTGPDQRTPPPGTSEETSP